MFARFTQEVIERLWSNMSLRTFRFARAKLYKLSEIAAGKDKNIKNSEKYGGNRYNVGEYSLSLQCFQDNTEEHKLIGKEVKNQKVSLQGYR